MTVAFLKFNGAARDLEVGLRASCYWGGCHSHPGTLPKTSRAVARQEASLLEAYLCQTNALSRVPIWTCPNFPFSPSKPDISFEQKGNAACTSESTTSLISILAFPFLFIKIVWLWRWNVPYVIWIKSFDQFQHLSLYDIESNFAPSHPRNY